MEKEKEIRILIVDDEPDIRAFLEYNLKKEGFLVKTANDGKKCLSLVESFKPHLILLDIMMPGEDGVEICAKLRQELVLKDTLIAFLTARSEEYSEIAGLEAGADDYIKKPIRIRVLLTRVKTLLKRHPELNQKDEKNTIKLRDIEIVVENAEVYKNNELVVLPKKEFDIVVFLCSRIGRVFSREEIYRAVWGSSVIVGNRTIDVHISNIRRKLGEDFILTVKGMGYKIK